MRWKVTNRQTGEIKVYEGQVPPNADQLRAFFAASAPQPQAPQAQPETEPGPLASYQNFVPPPAPTLSSMAVAQQPVTEPGPVPAYQSWAPPPPRVEPEGALDYLSRTPLGVRAMMATGNAIATGVPAIVRNVNRLRENAREVGGRVVGDALRGLGTAARIVARPALRKAALAEEAARGVASRVEERVVNPILSSARAWYERNLVAPPPPGRVRVIAPDGTRGTVTEDEADLARRMGYTIVE